MQNVQSSTGAASNSPPEVPLQEPRALKDDLAICVWKRRRAEVHALPGNAHEV
jgi:hypothetical protein